MRAHDKVSVSSVNEAKHTTGIRNHNGVADDDVSYSVRTVDSEELTT